MNPRQTMLLYRFERLLTICRDCREDANDAGLVLLERCTVATYVDCLEAGVEEEADRIARHFGAGKEAQP